MKAPGQCLGSSLDWHLRMEELKTGKEKAQIDLVLACEETYVWVASFAPVTLQGSKAVL